ncbi:MAG: hypothetical protein SWY16_20115 [Cyanobacteriota bacterium]|nr:hypothetical protein [Cyanobacteriota bacterium]
MDRFWWQIPGPNRFISEIVQDLADGKNVILCLPEHMPDGLSRAIRSELGEDWDWRTLSLRQEDGTEPVHLLFNRFVREISPTEIRNTRILVKHEDFAGKIIWLDDLTPNVWSAWKKFISDYEQPCRSVSKLERTVFCVPLSGDLALDPPSEDVCVSHQSWQGTIDRLDILLFTAHLFQGKQLSDLQKQVAISVTANLALWDPKVSERFAYENLENILSPIPILQDIAKKREWTDEIIPSESLWHKGMKDILDGEDKIHSAALAFTNFHREIDRRIWSAQVGVMLPFVEERRQELLESLKGKLEVPFQTDFGVIWDWRDLEIGHIEYQISSNGAIVNRETQKLVRRLKEIRNSLSHLEPIPPEILLCRELNMKSQKDRP